MRILLVNNIIDNTKELKSEISAHFILDEAFNSEEGIYLAQMNDYAAAIIEAGSRFDDGLDFCNRARAKRYDLPIMILMQNYTLEQKIQTLESGADVVLEYPVHPKEVFAYLRIMLTRRNSDNPRFLRVGDLLLDINNKEVFRANKLIQLRNKEYSILEHLMINKGLVITRNSLLGHIWQEDVEPYSNCIDVHIKNLRDKIDKPYKTHLIKTVYGYGYKLG